MTMTPMVCPACEGVEGKLVCSRCLDTGIVERYEEYHVTVEGDPMLWHERCTTLGWKPLYIQLNDPWASLQLMCQTQDDPRLYVEANGLLFGELPVLRVKHEVSELAPHEVALYHEAHVKINGVYRPNDKWSSRDLYRHNRWYRTCRRPNPFDGEAFYEHVKKAISFYRAEETDGYCYEAVILDTNPDLDKEWR